MQPEWLRSLRFQGYAPRSLLDVGAHLGHFTQSVLAVFPACRPTLIEPNPHCLPALAATGHEVHGVAASAEDGEAELFLTREWLQSTGTSLYRENTHFFRDDVLLRAPVPKRRLDDLLADRRFDLVKIDTQGAELDVLLGGGAVLRHADYILIEVSLVDYNQGGARAEAVFAALARLGFRRAEVVECHRLGSVRDGGLLQLDFLFERACPRPSQALGARLAGLPEWLAARPGHSVLHLGDGAPFPGQARDAKALRLQAARHGRFSHAICDLGAESLTDVANLLAWLPSLAEAGTVHRPAGAAWHWRDESGVVQLRPGGDDAPCCLQWRGAIAFQSAKPRRGRT